MLEYAPNIRTDYGARTPGHGREVVYGLNATNKRFLLMLITNVQFTNISGYDTQMAMYTSTQKEDISLARKFQKLLSNPTNKNGVIDLGKYRKWSNHKLGNVKCDKQIITCACVKCTNMLDNP